MARLVRAMPRWIAARIAELREGPFRAATP